MLRFHAELILNKMSWIIGTLPRYKENMKWNHYTTWNKNKRSSNIFVWQIYLTYSLTDVTPHIKVKPWISRKIDKAAKIIIKTQILLWKTIEGNWGLDLGLGWGIAFFYYILNSQSTDPWCNILQTLLKRKKYAKAMSDEHPLK